MFDFDDEVLTMEVWEIVGGADFGGIIVKTGEELSSQKYPERLSTGALVRQIELINERLHFKRLTGSGPEEGWISVTLMHKQLAVKTEKRPADVEEDPEEAPAEASELAAPDLAPALTPTSPKRPLCTFEVLLESLELHRGPDFSLPRPEAPQVVEGQVLTGYMHNVGKHCWLRLAEQTVQALGVDSTPMDGFWAPISIDLNMLGVGATLEVLGLMQQEPEPAAVIEVVETKADAPPAPAAVVETEPPQQATAPAQIEAEPVPAEPPQPAKASAEPAAPSNMPAVVLSRPVPQPAKDSASVVPPAAASGKEGGMRPEEPAPEPRMKQPADGRAPATTSDTPQVESEGTAPADDPEPSPAKEEPKDSGGMFDDLDAIFAEEDNTKGEEEEGVWEVVSGADRGGLLVKAGESLSTRKLDERLEFGALVKEIELIGDRLHFTLIKGEGPIEGWVTVKIGEKVLCARTKQPETEADGTAPASTSDTPQVESEGTAQADDPEPSPAILEPKGGGMFDDLDAIFAEEANTEEEEGVWEVVGGGERGGLLVKAGESLSTPKLDERLEVGALVKEIKLIGDRLHFTLIKGGGPTEGWVSVKIGEKVLCARTKQPETEALLAAEPGKGEAVVNYGEEPAAEAVEAAAATTEAAAEDDLERVPVPIGKYGEWFVANQGWKPPTFEEVVSMLKDFIAAYQAKEFQLECRTLPQGQAGFIAKQELLWSIQRPIIARYGFPPSKEGGQCLGELLQLPGMKKHEVIADLQAQIFTLLLDPALQDRLNKEREAKLAAERAAQETPEQLRQKQLEKEKKEERLKELTKQAAVGAETVLGIPIKYKVVSSTNLMQDPFWTAPVMAELEKGVFVRGYPGSKTWVKMDVECSAMDSVINPEIGAWMPAKKQGEGPGAGTILEAVWSEMKLDKAWSNALKLSWPGLDTPKAPFQAEYSLEWKTEAKPPERPVASSGLGLTPNKSITLTGIPSDSDVQVRATVRVNASERDVAGEIVLPGPWFTFRTLPDSAEEEPIVYAGQPELKGEGLYELQKGVSFFSEPNNELGKLYDLRKGSNITAIPRIVGRDPWLQLTEQTLPPPVSKEIFPGDSVWAPMSDSFVRVEDRAQPMVTIDQESWKVVHNRVMVRENPELDAKVLGFRTKGVMVRGSVVVEENGWEWLHTMYRPSSAAALQEAWMLIDGEPIGLPVLLQRGKEATAADVASWKASISRPMPPRPLTPAWMAAYGGLPAIYSVREELLPATEDVGMNSQCTLIYTAPAGGGSEKGYIAKRATVNDDLATKDTAEQEYRFYAEMVYPPPGESQPPEGEPVMLAGAVRVPRCHCVNFKAAGTAEEEDEDENEELNAKGRNQYFLMLEMFSPPYWVSMDPANGCTFEQAMSAVKSLGLMHNACTKKDVIEKLSWLPLTMFDLEQTSDSDGGMVKDYKTMFELNRGVLRQMLPDAGFHCAEKLSQGGIEEVAQRLAEAPVTFCHGDYRTENLRFGATSNPPEVGTFDFGLSCRARGSYDLAYFIILSQPPHLRRQRDMRLMWKYLETTEEEPTEGGLDQLFEEVKIGALGVLALTLITRIASRNAGFYKETRETQTRLLRWVSIAVEDWSAAGALWVQDPDTASAEALQN